MRTLCFGARSDGVFILNAIKKTRWEMGGGGGKADAEEQKKRERRKNSERWRWEKQW